MSYLCNGLTMFKYRDNFISTRSLGNLIRDAFYRVMRSIDLWVYSGVFVWR